MIAFNSGRWKPARRIVLATSVLCTVAGSTTAYAGPDTSVASLRELADARGVLIGAGIEAGPLDEAAYRTTLNQQFNAVTPGNELKWDATEPTRGEFDFTAADKIVDSAKENGQQVHGHTLVWYSQTPAWVSELDPDALREATQNHISTVVGRYAGQFDAWDVVNEPFNEDGTRRDTVWQRKLGDGYIAQALRWARAADPKTKLYVNDYNVEGVNDKSDALYELVRSLKNKGVPIDGVGLQGHFILGQVPGSMRENIQRFAELGVDVLITEVDIRIETPADDSELKQQAADYRAVADACLAVQHCRGITTWGITDKYSWVPDTFPGYGAALPYDENYRAKPAYNALNAALSG